MMTRAGVTSVHDAYGTPEDLQAYQDARASGELRLRVYCSVGSTHLPKMLAAGVRTGLGDEWVRVGFVKATCDGSISERTARLAEPYVGRPDDHGIIVTDEAALLETLRPAHRADWQLGVHANGDAGIDILLRVYERLQQRAPSAATPASESSIARWSTTLSSPGSEHSARSRRRFPPTSTTTARR